MKRVKATYYIEPEHLNVLEAERIHRINAGVARSECSVSDLVNEAIRRAFGANLKAAGQMRALKRMGGAPSGGRK